MKQRRPISRQAGVFGQTDGGHVPKDIVSGRSSVLFALFEEGHPTASLLRALSHARTLDADLRVLRILPKPSRANAHIPQTSAADEHHDQDHAHRVDSETREWLRPYLGERGSSTERFALLHGDFVYHVARQAVDFGAKLIVIPPCEEDIGGLITALACATNVPVLMAREVAGGTTIIVAADIDDDRYPDLLRASELALRLAAPVLGLHDLEWAAAPENDLDNLPATVSDRGWDETEGSRANKIASAISTNGRARAHGDEAFVEAILSEARDHDTELIVVGTQARNWEDRLVKGSVAEQVVDRARRSVLVLPIHDTGLTYLSQPGRA